MMVTNLIIWFALVGKHDILFHFFLNEIQKNDSALIHLYTFIHCELFIFSIILISTTEYGK